MTTWSRSGTPSPCADLCGHSAPASGEVGGAVALRRAHDSPGRGAPGGFTGPSTPVMSRSVFQRPISTPDSPFGANPRLNETDRGRAAVRNRSIFDRERTWTVRRCVSVSVGDGPHRRDGTMSRRKQRDEEFEFFVRARSPRLRLIARSICRDEHPRHRHLPAGWQARHLDHQELTTSSSAYHSPDVQDRAEVERIVACCGAPLNLCPFLDI